MNLSIFSQTTHPPTHPPCLFLYVGKWYAPMIDNPAYIGEWSPRQIPNPHFFVDKEPHNFPPIAALALEVWTTNPGLRFDSFYIGDDATHALEYGQQTWKVKFDAELKEEEAAIKANKKNEMGEGWKGKAQVREEKLHPPTHLCPTKHSKAHRE